MTLFYTVCDASERGSFTPIRAYTAGCMVSQIQKLKIWLKTKLAKVKNRKNEIKENKKRLELHEPSISLMLAEEGGKREGKNTNYLQ